MNRLSEKEMTQIEAGCLEAVALAILLDNPILAYECVPDIQ